MEDNYKIYSDANRIRKAGLEFEEDNEIHYEHIRFEVVSEQQYWITSWKHKLEPEIEVRKSSGKSS